MSRKILIAYDESEPAKKAIEWVLSHAILLPTDTIYIATVVNDTFLAVEGASAWNTATVGGTDYLVQDYYQRVDELEKNIQTALDNIVKHAQSQNLNVTGKLLKGETVDILMGFVEDYKIDMVIVGNRGLGYLKRKLLGSVSEHLSHHLKCPLLIVKS